MIDLVRETEISGVRGDSAAMIMYSAYAYAFRRLVVIRDVAATGAGAETMVLARSLLSLVARAAYVDDPTDLEERRRRFFQYRVRDLRQRLQLIEELAAAEFDVSDYEDPAELEAQLAEIGDVGRFPDDRSLMRDHLNLLPFYARVYRPTSDYVHFAQWTALAPMSGETIDFAEGDRAAAGEALAFAVITFGTLLEVSEKAVGHGLSEIAHELAELVVWGE